MSDPFIAEIRMFGLNFAPRGWAFCDGQLLPISQNTALFSLVGTTYGGDGRTTLGLPDLRGRAPMHPGLGPGLSSYRLGQIGGAEAVSLTDAQLPAHSHPMSAISSEGDEVAPEGVYPAQASAARGQAAYAALADTTMAADALGTSGSRDSHNNRQPYTAVNFCIAMMGVFPSRS